MEDLGGTHWWYLARKEIVCDTVKRSVAKNSKLLDFGSGSGGIAKTLAADGYKVVAADISSVALAACRKAGLDTLALNTSWPAAQSVDCILACDVAEITCRLASARIINRNGAGLRFALERRGLHLKSCSTVYATVT